MSNCHYASTQLTKVLSRIENACADAGRDPSTVTLVGASKKQSASLINDFAAAGLRNVGENYLQEAIEKQSELQSADLDWHFIGQIQSNKTKLIATHFSWVHGVDRYKIARRLSDQNQTSNALNLLLQINADDEESKGGAELAEVPELCAQISALPNVHLRGFMLIPKPRESYEAQRRVFANARGLLEATNAQHGLSMDQLSMGMSSDLEAAVAEGSTMVRIGTDLFGPR